MKKLSKKALWACVGFVVLIIAFAGASLYSNFIGTMASNWHKGVAQDRSAKVGHTFCLPICFNSNGPCGCGNGRRNGSSNGNGSTKSASTVSPNNFGLMMVQPPDLSMDQMIAVAHQLGVSNIRNIALSLTMAPNNKIALYQHAGFNTLLEIANSVCTCTATKGIKDIATYKEHVGTIIDTYHPTLIVVENEENNLQYYVGTADQYIAQLQATIDVAHSKGIKVADGGFVQSPLVFLVWKQMWDSGDRVKADTFAQEALGYERDAGKALLATLPTSSNPNRKIVLPRQMARDIAMTRALLPKFKTMDLDYVNIHWYENDVRGTPALAQLVSYLQKATGKQVITNESGQLDKSPATTLSLLQAFHDLKLAYVVWANLDYDSKKGAGVAGDGSKAYALDDATGTLRPNGIAFQKFMQTTFGLKK